MARQRRQSPKTQLQLRIELEHSQPLIWRVVLVPGNITLVKLHQVIQTAMGWWDGHLHEFIIDHRHYGRIFAEDPMMDIGPELLDERHKRLTTVLGGKRRFDYLYDFGDSWWHKIRVEAEVPRIEALPQAVCLGGEMACPPEDVGGIPGYFAFLETVSDPSHEEHAEILEWCGGAFDPRAFDIVATNAMLANIRL
jgi:hypothetical protein